VNGGKYKIIRLLGAGGQGEVYEAEGGGKHCALKWYFKQMATPAQKKILENLIVKGSPDSAFLWPEDLTLPGHDGSFGYIMDLRPNHYKSIVDLMKRKIDPSFRTLCRAAYNLTKGYQDLHAMGFCYRDISFGNVFLDGDTGDVLICDNDNVSADEDSSVYGTPRFMAPEIVVGKAKPSRNTDLFSLAVLLFYMLMLAHPLEGRLEANVKCMDIHAMNRLYGTHPVFIFDPDDDSNRPAPGYQDNALLYWAVYPESVKNLFISSFTTGLTEPNKRVTEHQWMDALANLYTGAINCPSCGAEVFADEGQNAVCWNCKKDVPQPVALIIEKSVVMMYGGAHLYAHHTTGDYYLNTVTGTVVQNPHNPQLWGIRNESADNWTYIRANGAQTPILPGQTAAIVKAAQIDFKGRIGAFK
jgi:serine/threonine protein kinase